MQDELDYYDAIDTLDRVHKATLSLENKFQTKREGKSVDLVRFILSTEYAFSQDYDLPRDFNNLKAEILAFFPRASTSQDSISSNPPSPPNRVR